MSEPFVAALGRISGKLLTANLLRNGADLTFRNGPTSPDLLYLDVNNGRVGINAAPPTQALDLTGSARVSQNTIVTGTKTDVGNLIFNTSGTVSSSVGPIIIRPNGVDAYVQYGKVLTPEFEIKDNYIRSTQTNSDISLSASGTGKVDIQASTDIAGNLAVAGNIQSTGNVRLDGQFIIGDSPLDTVAIAPDFTQSIIPGLTGTYDFGTTIKRWRNLSLYDMNGADAVTTQNLFISDQVQFNNANTISTLQSNDNLIVDSATGKVRIDDILFDNTFTVIDAVSTYYSYWIDISIPFPPPSWVYNLVGWTAHTQIGDRLVTEIASHPGYLTEFPIGSGTYITTTRIYLNGTNLSGKGDEIVLSGGTNNPEPKITNLTNGALTLSHTGRGYLTINDTNAFRIPFGTTAERTPVEVGATRWNSEIGYLECFDGSVWQVATGGGIVITSAIMEDLSHVYTLIFG